MMRLMATLMLLLCSIHTVTRASAQTSELVFPENPAVWINSSPFTLQSLKGKGAILYFFEET